jgi:crossover junction endodeoxyribonuclease RusA
MISFTAYGKPEPQGSVRAFVHKGTGRPILTSANPKVKDWREVIAWGAREAMAGEQPYEGPIEIRASFYMPRPKSVKREHPTVKPDLDKLQRALLDALTSIVYRDDAQVVEIRASKHYVNAEVPQPCVGVWVSEMGGEG